MWPICVLLWMHYIGRKRFYLLTLVDFLGPFAMATIAHVIFIFMSPKNQTNQESKTLDLDMVPERPVRVLYAPTTGLTDQLMKQAGTKLNLQRLDHLPNETESGYFPLFNVTPLSVLKYSKNMSPTDAIVIFEGYTYPWDDVYKIKEDMKFDSWPLKLNYTIRMKTDPKPYQDLEYIIALLFHEPYGKPSHSSKDRLNTLNMQYQPFMRLQWAIDTSYLELLTGADLDQKWMVQEFRHGDKAPGDTFYYCFVTSFVLTSALMVSFYHLANRLYDEKNSGINEFIKMAGVSWGTLSLSHVINEVPILVFWTVGGFIYFEVTDSLLTGGGFVAAAMALHFLTVVAFVFVFLYVFDIVDYVQTVSTHLYTGTLVAATTLVVLVQNQTVLLVSCFLPHVPFVMFWMSVASKEMNGGVTISNFWHNDDTHDGTLFLKVPLTVGGAYIFMLLQIILYSMLAWYLSRVRPGKHGQALPWTFLWRKEYWRMVPMAEVAPVRQARGADEQYFEKPSAGLPVGIQITEVYKMFGADEVLHGVSMAAYKGEITVLLGHNGAGKTTLISIITGLMSATSGRVLVDGMDTVTQSVEVRKRMGQCPQRDVLFTYLNILEHVMFFAMIKGQTFAESKTSATQLLARLNLSSKANELVVALSGGMKRRTQLACALTGSASVLLLDEPTSGLDVETRRELWNLLLSLRGDHTVLLTTHYMEEADALGDRIVALRRGVVQCHGSPMFLKRAIGTGYRLSFTTIGVPQESAITNVIRSVVPDAAVLDLRPGAISYSLPSKEISKFPQLFSALEGVRAELGINNIGVGRSSLEEVFVELCSDAKVAFTEELDTKITEPVYGTVSGARLRKRQFAVLLMRQWSYFFTRLRGSLFMACLVILGMGAATAFNNNKSLISNDNPSSDVTLSLDLFADRPQRVMVSVDDEAALEALRNGNSGVQFDKVPDVAEAVLRAGRENSQNYKRYQVGIELNGTYAKVMYTTRRRHAAPVALNLLSNAQAARVLGGVAGRTVVTRADPLRGAYVPYEITDLDMPKDEEHLMTWVRLILFLIGLYFITFLVLPYTERATLTRHSHLLTGCPLPLYWAATVTAMLARALPTCLLPLLLFTYALETDHTINRPGFTIVLCVLILLGFLAMPAMGYFITTLPMKQANGFGVFIMIIVICSLNTPSIQLSLSPTSAWYLTLVYIPYVLVPVHTLAVGVSKAALLARANAFCNLNRDKCPTLDAPKPFETDKCCGSASGSEPWGYWAMTGEAAGWEVIILVGQFIAYMLLTLTSDAGVWGRLQARLRESGARAPPARCSDDAARAEADYVEEAIKLPKKNITDAILCHNLQKMFPDCNKKKSFFAVKGISFSIKKGECFGLLGVNGAGKSTIFKMLTAETCPSRGSIFANGHYLSERSSYMRTLSYCPQFSTLDEFLTGRQNMVLVLTLRGLKDADIRTVADSWIAETGLERHADKPLWSYSGGCSRRLAAAAALCQRARTALLDEPSAGVDPVARRGLHRAIRRASRDRSLIVTSHSLEEIEELCHRIGIMSNGELCALGSAAALKAQHATGYSVSFKLSSARVGPEVDDFKRELQSKFDCSLQDQHLTALSYNIKNIMPYSELFELLEQLRQEHSDLIEDYSVTEATLEEVFLALAKKAHEPETATP